MNSVTEVNQTALLRAVPALSKGKVRGRIEALLDAGYTLARLATETGLAKSDLRAWQKWDASEDVDLALAQWLAEIEQEASESEPGYCETPTGLRYLSGFEQAQSDPSIFIGGGVAGCGKSSALAHYAQHVAPRAVLHVTASPAVKKFTAVLDSLLRELNGYGNVSDSYRTVAMIDALLREMKRQYRLIVIDEAQHLEYEALEGLRIFLDDFGIGLAFLGNEKTYKDFSGTGQAARFAQLSSRVGRRMMVLKPEEGDIDAMLAAWGVKGRREREFMQAVGMLPGALRNVHKVVKAARRLGGTDLVFLKSAVKYINMPGVTL